MRRRIGIPVRYSPRSHNEVSSTDSFRHFALAYGDDNPLYTDPELRPGVVVGLVDRPALVPVHGRDRAPGEVSDAEKAEMAGGDPLAGIGQYMCGERWLFAKPDPRR